MAAKPPGGSETLPYEIAKLIVHAILGHDREDIWLKINDFILLPILPLLAIAFHRCYNLHSNRTFSG
jgi:hypothetical protein